MVERRKSLVIIVSSFIISLLFLSVNLQLTSGALNETRKSTLLKKISSLQVKDLGAFRPFDYIPAGGYLCEVAYANAPITSKSLVSLKILNGLDTISLSNATYYLVMKQHPKQGGYGIFYGYDGTSLGLDLGSTYSVVDDLKTLGELHRLNRNRLITFVLARYNESTGAFNELLTQAYNKSYAFCAFGMSFHVYNDELAYAIPNIISTFLGLSILANLNALDTINVTKTFEWIMCCKTDEGLFMPYPNATYSPLPGWSPLRTNPFDVDGGHHSGTPYIYAALGALNAIGRLDALNHEEKQNIKDYIIMCQSSSGVFRMHSAENHASQSWWTEYAIMSLYYLNMLKEAEQNVKRTVNYIVENQNLDTDKSVFPIPNEEYGLFSLAGSDFLGDANRAVRILNVTNNLSLLDTLTPRVFTTIRNILLLSLIAPVSIAVVLIARSVSTAEEPQDNQPPQQEASRDQEVPNTE